MTKRGNQLSIIVLILFTPRSSIITYNGPLKLKASLRSNAFLVHVKQNLSVGVLSVCPSMSIEFSAIFNQGRIQPSRQTVQSIDANYKIKKEGDRQTDQHKKTKKEK